MPSLGTGWSSRTGIWFGGALVATGTKMFPEAISSERVGRWMSRDGSTARIVDVGLEMEVD